MFKEFNIVHLGNALVQRDEGGSLFSSTVVPTRSPALLWVF